MFQARKDFLNVGIEFGQLLLEKLQLRDHAADEQIEGRILRATRQGERHRFWSRFRTPSGLQGSLELLQTRDAQDGDGAQMMHSMAVCSQHRESLFTKEKGAKRK